MQTVLKTTRKRAGVSCGARIRYFFIDYIIYHIFPDFSSRFPEKCLKTNDFSLSAPDADFNNFHIPNCSAIFIG